MLAIQPKTVKFRLLGKVYDQVPKYKSFYLILRGMVTDDSHSFIGGNNPGT